MTPERMTDRLAEWVRVLWRDGRWVRRVDYVEDDGARRTWVLWEGGRQVGHVRLRFWQGAEGQREWLYEASDRTRAMLGLDDAAEPGQTGGEG